MNMDDRYDNRLFSILEEVKTLPNFLNVFFGFLYRRTDYFQISTDPNIGVGLPNGVAQKLLLQTFKKYASVSNKEEEQVKSVRKYEHATNKEEEQVQSVRKYEHATNKEEEQVQSVKKYEHATNKEEEQVQSVRKYENVSNKEEQSVKKPENVSNFDAYNGAVFETYAWSQTISDIDIQIKIPDEIRSKQLQIDITSTQLLIKLRNSPSSVVYLKGELCKKCKMNETVWSLDGQTLQIHLEKLFESWWDCLLTNEPRLDFNKMDCSRPYHELSEEARVKIEQLTWDQEQRNRGCLTSEQISLQRTLQKAWNVEGSPFSGEYDPTKVNLG